MIFYKALKYKIFEICMDSFFNTVLKNFGKSMDGRIRISDIPRGMIMKRIEYDGVIYYNCQIIEAGNGHGINALGIFGGYAAHQTSHDDQDLICLVGVDDPMPFIRILEH